MINRLILACALLCAFSANVSARQRIIIADPGCNQSYPNAPLCIGVSPSLRGERIARKLPFGSPQMQYKPAKERHSRVKVKVAASVAPVVAHSLGGAVAQIVAHPAGCPRSAFCGCGAAVRIFGSPIRSLWLAANWFKFPRAAPASGMVAVRRHHVFVLEQHLGGNTWQVYDANSGRHLTRVYARSIAGYTIVNPRGAG